MLLSEFRIAVKMWKSLKAALIATTHVRCFGLRAAPLRITQVAVGSWHCRNKLRVEFKVSRQ